MAQQSLGTRPRTRDVIAALGFQLAIADAAVPGKERCNTTSPLARKGYRMQSRLRKPRARRTGCGPVVY